MTFRGERGICRHLSDLKLQPCWWQPRWWQPRWWQRVRVQDSMAQMHLHMRTESPAQQYPLRRKRKDPKVTSRERRPSARCVRTTEPRSLEGNRPRGTRGSVSSSETSLDVTCCSLPLRVERGLAQACVRAGTPLVWSNTRATSSLRLPLGSVATLFLVHLSAVQNR